MAEPAPDSAIEPIAEVNAENAPADASQTLGSAANDTAGRTEGVALTGALGVDRKSFTDAWGMVFEQAITQPSALFDAGTQFARNMAEVWLTGSDLAPPAGDKRFNDPAWQSNPIFKRMGQSYFAWANSLDTWLEASGLTGINRERARFVLDNAKDVAAPVNTLIGNPEALARARDTRGQSVLNGIKNLADDFRHNHGYPAVADRNGFVVGRDVAATEGAVVFRNDLFELIQYQATTNTVHQTPLLYVFSQVNRFYLGDLTPDRSLFQRLLDAGHPVYAISWRNPEKDHQNWNLGTYAEGVIHAIDVIRQISDTEQVDLMGLCAGGLTSAVAAGALKARGDEWINTLSLFVNVLDNRPEDSDFGLFVSERSIAAQKEMVRQQGLFNEKNVFEMFAMLRLEENVMSFYRRNYLMGEDPLKHPLLFWSMDYTRVPGGLHSEFLDMSLDNKLAKREYRALGKRIDLKAIDYPVYIMAGSTDHITPWKACYRSTQLFSGPVDFVLTNQNHTQTISSRDDNKHLKYWTGSELPEESDRWEETAKAHAGSWTHQWINWLNDHAKEGRIDAPTEFGTEVYGELDPAPGRYVVDK